MNVKMCLRDAYSYNPNIFAAITDDNMPTDVSADTVKNHVIIRGGGRYVGAYSIALLTVMVADVVETRKYNWQRMQAALTAEYDPIENVKEHTEYSDSEETTGTSAGNSASTSTSSGTGTSKGVSYDSADLKETAKQEQGADAEGSSTSTNTMEGKRTFTHTQDRHGNIGVTSNQSMVSSEEELFIKYNIYDMIADDIINAICLEVY